MSETQDRTDEPTTDGTIDPNDAAQSGADDAAATDEGDETSRLEGQLRRSMADLANLRKRMHKEVDDARRRAVEGMSAELLPVLDNFHLALGVTDGDAGAYDPATVVEGMRMVKSLLESVLERHGLKEISAQGEPFDPNRHEAVGVDTQAACDEGLVTQVVQRGYTIGDKVLRATRVLVRGSADEGAGG
ncbi:MAG: nucleotide exchange factor GrpE [Planctomycetota bacterium]|jgi:molecular chaperone GrpE